MIKNENCEITKNVVDLIYKFGNINPDSELIMEGDIRENYGIDSLVIVEMLLEIESIFNISIDSDVLTYEFFSTPRKIVDYIKKLTLN